MERQIKPAIVTLLLFLAGSASELMGQSIVTQAPDCYRTFTFTAVANGATLANYGTGSPDGGNACTVWQLSYAVASTGTVTSLSLLVQSAPPGTTEPVAGTWVTYAGTVVTGVNPNVNIVGRQTTLSNGVAAVPFIRVALTALSATGTTVVFGVLQGWSEGNSAGATSSTCAGTSAAPCIVAGPDASGVTPTQSPVLTAGIDGTNVRTIKTDNQGRTLIGAYPSSAAVSLSASGLTQIIAASGATVITIGSISASFQSAVDFQLEYGTGANCGTGTTALTGIYRSILAVALDNPLFVPASQAVCVNLGSAVVGGGLVEYNQQ